MVIAMYGTAVILKPILALFFSQCRPEQLRC